MSTIFVGIINSEGQLWRKQRHYIRQRRLGVSGHSGASNLMPRNSTQRMNECIQHEASTFISTINRDFTGKSLDPAVLLNCAVANIICSLIMSTRFHHNDKAFQRFMFLFDEGFRIFMSTGYATFIYFLEWLPGVRTKCDKLERNREEMVAFVREIIDEHKATVDLEGESRDLIDAYLQKMAKMTKEESREFFEGFDPEKQLEQVVLDLFSAGVETSKTTLLWAIVYMLHNPEEMRKIQEELLEKVGPNRMPNMDDRDALVYTRAALYEVMRRSSVVPLGTTHATTRDIEFEGKTIPKNTHIIPLLYGVHMSPDVWDQPKEFRPSRFLSDDGKSVVRPADFMPFGAGHRMCLGDQLAERELFLFFASFLHAYDFAVPEGNSTFRNYES